MTDDAPRYSIQRRGSTWAVVNENTDEIVDARDEKADALALCDKMNREAIAK